jgi:hypothetical protein
MTGLHRNLQLGPDTALVSAPVSGGQLLEADPVNVGFVRPASAGSTTVVGVAFGDAQPAGTNPGVGANAGPLNIGWAHPEVAVQFGPADVDLVYSASATYGVSLVASAGGTVAPAGATSTASVNTTLAASSLAGATTISTAATIAAGTFVTIDSGTNQETRTTSAVSGAGPYTVTVPALTYGHSSGATVTAPASGSGAAAAVGNVVGRCTAPFGVSAGSAGRARLYL